MTRDGIDRSLVERIGPDDAYDIAYGTFRPRPQLEDDPLTEEDKANYQAIGGAILAIATLGSLATVVYGTTLGLSWPKALLMAFILVAGLFAFGVAMATFRKSPFIIGLLGLGMSFIVVAVAIVVDLLSGGTTSRILFDESSYVTPEGEIAFAVFFGGGSLFLAFRLMRSPRPFYGLR